MTSPRKVVRLAIVSDIHYASPEEVAESRRLGQTIQGPLRSLVTQYRRFWLRNPFVHNHLLDQFLQATSGADFAVANGDYSCDIAWVGVSHDAAMASARICLDKLRGQFEGRLQATLGDHEIGKKMLGSNIGGLRVASYHRATRELNLAPCWSVTFGRHVLIGVTSTLAALPIYEMETLPEEEAEWRALRAEHMAAIASEFDRVRADQQILLFCHDPSALPFLGEIESVRRAWPRLQRTIIGHLHSPAILRLSGWLSGMPVIRFLGHTPRRHTTALRRARQWKPFRPLLCPSLAGIELLKDGGYYTVDLDPDGTTAPKFEFHPLQWRTQTA